MFIGRQRRLRWSGLLLPSRLWRSLWPQIVVQPRYWHYTDQAPLDRIQRYSTMSSYPSWISSHCATPSWYSLETSIYIWRNRRCQRRWNSWRFWNSLASSNTLRSLLMCQKAGSTLLSHVMTARFQNDVIVSPPTFSDHGPVVATIPFLCEPFLFTMRRIRRWKRLGRAAFRMALRAHPLFADVESSAHLSTSEMFSKYEDALSGLLDTFAPICNNRSRHYPSAPWFDASCRALRR